MKNRAKQRQNIIKRLQALDSTILRKHSKVSNQISYQRGTTKTALIKLVRSLPHNTADERRSLRNIEGVLEQYERVQAFGEKGLVQNYYDVGSEETRRFIRIQEEKGWSSTEILLALENNYDAIQHMGSDDMWKFTSVSDEDGTTIFE